MNRRGVRLASLFEWLAAMGAVLALVWLAAVPVQRAIGPRVQAAIPELAPVLATGIPATALAVPVILLLDGREIRQGELQADVAARLHERDADGPVHTTTGAYGDRHVRTYRVDGIRFVLICEAQEAGGPMRVTALYLP